MKILNHIYSTRKNGNYYYSCAISRNGKTATISSTNIVDVIIERDILQTIIDPPKRHRGWGRSNKSTNIKYLTKNSDGKIRLTYKGTVYGTYRTIMEGIIDKIFWTNINYDMDLLDLH